MVSVRRVAPVLLLVIAIPLFAAAQKSSTRPPRDLHRVGDHWTAYNPPDPSTYAPNAKTYTIKAGDTLWGLAQQFYKNAYLWPQLWEGNTWITDAHWIYPGDVILVGGEAQSAEAATAQTSTPSSVAPTETTSVPSVVETSTTSPPVPLAIESDLYCYGYIGALNEPLPNQLHSFEDVEMRYHFGVKEQTDHASTGDLVFISGGTSTGLVAGDTYLLVEPNDIVTHPQTKAVLGRQYTYVGQVKVLCAEATSSRGMITQSCREISNNARLKPLPQIPIPIARVPDMPAFCDPATARSNGYIVSSRGWENGLGINDLVQIDLGHDDQINPGDFLTIYRASPLAGQPRQVLGELAILTTESHTATARVVAMRRIIEIGDRVEAR
jgi:LysM repeat protein